MTRRAPYFFWHFCTMVQLQDAFRGKRSWLWAVEGTAPRAVGHGILHGFRHSPLVLRPGDLFRSHGKAKGPAWSPGEDFVSLVLS